MTAWKNKQQKVSTYDLIKQLPTIKYIDWIADVPAQSLQGTIERLDKAYKSFFKGGGFPKFKSKKDYNSITFKQGNFKRTPLKPLVRIFDSIIHLPKIGELKFFKDKSRIIGKIKTATIKKEPTGYFVYIVCDEVNKTISNPDESQVIGIDLGVAHFIADSNGNFIENPKYFKKYEEKLAEEQRILSGRIKFSNRWKKQAKKVALVNHKIANVRKDFLHKESTNLAKRYHTVFVEDLRITNMTKRAKTKQNENGKFLPNGQSAKSGLNKAILDSGWGMFREMLEYKTNVIRINPKHTSTTCNECGHNDSENRVSQSEFICKCCGHTANADVNGAKNVLSRGTALVENTETLCVKRGTQIEYVRKCLTVIV